jgi:hypothetical protein
MKEREFVTSNDKPRIVAYRYNVEASIDVSYRHAQAVAQCKSYEACDMMMISHQLGHGRQNNHATKHARGDARRNPKQSEQA